MTEWVEIRRVPLTEDLAVLCRYLQGSDVPTWVFERAGEQCLCVPSSVPPAQVQRLLLAWQSGVVDEKVFDTRSSAVVIAASPTIFSDWRRFPFTLLLLLLSVAAFIMVSTPWGQRSGGLWLLSQLSLQSVHISEDSMDVLAEAPSLTQIWRYWTPIFLHFNLLHIVFNGLMLLEIGRRIERMQGSMRLLVLVFVCGFVSNQAQFYADPNILFGGMSGVIYALIGYGWLYSCLFPRAGLVLLPPGLMAMALLWLILCFSGVLTWAGMGHIANAAHAGGLVAGLACAWLLAGFDKFFVN